VNALRFIDGKAELDELNAIEKLSRKKLFMAAVYGLRRVGKSHLLLEFLKERGLHFQRVIAKAILLGWIC
jgi:hypothetical protein